MPQKSRLSIFDYVDYRFFLADYFSLQKKNVRGFSFRSFAKKAGLSASLLKDILSKRQNLTLQVMHGYARAMDLGAREIAYFEALLGFNNAATNNEKNRFFGEMVRLRGRSSVKFLDSKQYDFFSQWYNAVVRELMVHAGYGDDAAAIARRITPAVSVAKVRRSLALLKDLGLVYKDGDGVWRATDKVISSEYQIQSVALRNYHTGMLERARETLDTVGSDDREFQGMTISASRATFERMKERIRSFTDELLGMAAADSEKADEVYQVNLQMFPFTRRNGRS
jgi:uncharacterized protein (TIGR02147 family)